MIDRRRFLKFGIGGAGILALGEMLPLPGLGQELKPGGEEVSRTTGKARVAIPSTCFQCAAGCGILGYVDTNSGRLVKIEGNPLHPNNRGKLCARGQAGTNLVNNPDRLLFPLKRTGKRGEMRWEQISWDQAIQELSTKLQELKAKGQADRFIFQGNFKSKENATLNFVRRFLHAYGTSSDTLETSLGGASRETASLLTYGEDVLIPDISRSKYILNFGGNPYEAYLFHLPLIQRLNEARMNGARLVTFDVRISNTSGRSDEWYPITPGTDGFVAMAMARTIIEEGLHDRQFLEEWTNFPLVHMRRHLDPYTPEAAQKVSGVPAAVIRRLAREFATTKPATTLTGRGVSMRQQGTQNERCVALLNAVIGNVDVPGGPCFPRRAAIPDLTPVPPKVSQASPFHHNNLFSDIARRKIKVGIYLAYTANPVYASPDSGSITQVFKDERLIPYSVAVDTFMSETAILCDLVLPDATYLERWDLESGPSFEHVPYVSLRQPLVTPPPKVKPFTEVCLDLARRIPGVEPFFPYRSFEDYLEKVAPKIDGLAGAGGFEALKKKGVWFNEKAKPRFRQYRGKGFKTASRRFEVYSEAMHRQGFAGLPSYEPEKNGRTNGRLMLATFKGTVRGGSRTAACKWLAEIQHDNPLWLHPETAAALHVREGDQVRLKTANGTVTQKVRISQGVHPQVVACAEGFGHWGHGRIARGKSFKSSDPDTLLVWWEGQGSGIYLNAIVPKKEDPVSQEYAWMETEVEVAKV
ncbi:MAG TPA: molybdopterin-dependent oxidoreductase [bacterium]|nr:molybdopterin-dependent oxidoreductase [bacterium]